MFDNFFSNLMLHGLEYFKRYYGSYMAIVRDNKDPEGRGRIQAYCPEVGQQDPGPTVWIQPSFPGAGKNRGSFWPPEIGDGVWVRFSNGDPSKPKSYQGGWFGSAEVPSEFATDSDVPNKRGFVTRGGHSIVFSDTPGDERVELTWHKPSSTVSDRTDTPARTGQVAFLRFSEESIILQVKDTKTQIVIEDGKITIDAENVDVCTGADTPAVRGNEWLQWASSHTHGTPWGPSSPPIQPPPSTILSKCLKIK
jgi:uncharacterized protein involved in type VI secretion and phage assembly